MKRQPVTVVAALTANQIAAGAAYADDGVALASLSVTVRTSLGIFNKAGTISIAQDAATRIATARRCAIYEAGASLGVSPIIALVAIGSDRANTAGPLLIYRTGDKILKWKY